MENPNSIDKTWADTQEIVTSQEDSKKEYFKLKSSVLESLKAKIDHITSHYFSLSEIVEKKNHSIKLKFYEDKSFKIQELESLKETLDNEYQSINVSYQNDQKFIQLLQIDEETNITYLKYIETYKEFSERLRQRIESLIAESFSPYSCENPKILFSVNSHMDPIELIQYDIEKSQQKIINISLNGLLTNDEVSVVELPNNELFCFGCVKRNKSKAWIMDMNSYEIKRYLPSIQYPRKSGILYYQQGVYIISGLLPITIPLALLRSPVAITKKEKNYNKRFDLIKNKWVSFPKTPRSITSCSAVPFKHKIIMTGVECEKFIFEYDINLEIFNKIDFIQKPTEKLLMAGNSRIYLLESWGSLWETEYDNEYSWHQISKFDERLFSAQPYRISSRQKVYFGVFQAYYRTSKLLYYEFDLKEKKFKEIQSFEGPEVGEHFEYEYD